jgi:hypothetical protein
MIIASAGKTPKGIAPMSEEIIAAVSTRSFGQTEVSIERRARIRYEVWNDKTLVLRTVHQTQALRYANEIQGEVRTVQQSGWS